MHAASPAPTPAPLHLHQTRMHALHSCLRPLCLPLHTHPGSPACPARWPSTQHGRCLRTYGQSWGQTGGVICHHPGSCTPWLVSLQAKGQHSVGQCRPPMAALLTGRAAPSPAPAPRSADGCACLQGCIVRRARRISSGEAAAETGQYCAHYDPTSRAAIAHECAKLYHSPPGAPPPTALQARVHHAPCSTMAPHYPHQ